MHTTENAGEILISTRELATTSAITTPNSAETNPDRKQ